MIARHVSLFLASMLLAGPVFAQQSATHDFKIGTDAFLLDGKPLQIRCGEIHFARIPREYWRDRLRRCKAMGLNTVCAYLFWNLHEWEPGKYNWEGQADAAEFVKIAQEEGLWVILRPGPYACAEWEMGGLPWWLLKDTNIRLRTTDPMFLEPSRNWLKEVGRVLGPMQVTHGGPILMVQVENEYGSYGSDESYMRAIREALIDAGFDVPLFACNGPKELKNGYIPELFQVVNLGKDPAGGFKALREVQPTGPLMVGEFYPGWFDTWGEPHHVKPMEGYLQDLEYMLKNGASFSIYMAHGGTTFGMWSGADRPYKPDTSSYDYDAPISEAGWSSGEKFRRTRELFSRYLQPGEKLPDVPADNPVMKIAPFEINEFAGLWENLPQAVGDSSPRNMEAYSQAQGCIVYRTTLPAGGALKMDIKPVHDFAFVLLDGKQIGVLDRRTKKFTIEIPSRQKSAQLDILVDTMGRVNFSKEIFDMKGIVSGVTFSDANMKTDDWQVFNMPLDQTELSSLKWKNADGKSSAGFWRGHFKVDNPQDTFLDLHNWGKGVVWINGRCLARYWDIGPTQTAYVPAPWLKQGENEVVILDLIGPRQATSAGLEKPVLDELHPELDFAPQANHAKK